MKIVHVKLIALTLVLLVMGSHVAPGWAAPAQQGANLLKNPGFEAPYTDDGAAHDWVRWHRQSSEDEFGDCTNGYHKLPRWGNATDFKRDGGSAQYVGNNWDTWSAGVWQNVSVTPGSTYRFTFYARGRGASEPAPAPSDHSLNMNIRAGIDPNGSGVWHDGDVVWGTAGSPHDQWQQFSVEATATGDTITVFTSADWGIPGVNQCRRHLDTYYDSAQLVEVAPPPTATSPPPPPPPPATNTPLPPTNTPTPEVTPTNTPIPTDTPTPTPEPPAGAIVCVNAFNDEDASGTHEADEGFIAGVTFTVASSEEVVGQAVSPGRDEPVCFEELEPGTYQVAQIVPGRLEMTTAANAVLEVEEGKTYGVEFGSRIRPTAANDAEATGPDVLANNPQTTTVEAETDEPAAVPEAGSGFSLLAFSGLAVIVLAVALLGVLTYFWWQRP